MPRLPITNTKTRETNVHPPRPTRQYPETKPKPETSSVDLQRTEEESGRVEVEGIEVGEVCGGPVEELVESGGQVEQESIQESESVSYVG